MKLIYRGKSYTPSNKTAFINSQTTLVYRGQSYKPSGAIATMPKENLVYRGVPYVQSYKSTFKGTYTPAFN